MVANPAYLESQSQSLTQQILHLGLILVGNEVTETAFTANPALATIAEQTSLTRPNTTLPIGSYNATLGAWEMPSNAEFQFSNGATPTTVAQCFVVKGGNAFAGNNDGTIVLLHTFPTPIALAANQTVILKTPWRWE
jgi:hypothetical protein